MAIQMVSVEEGRPEANLVRYDAACRALAEAKSVDEVKDVRDRAEAMRAYARQAKNKQLEVDAAEIRIRAERRLGEMIAGQREAGLLSKGAATEGVGKRGSQKNPRSAPTLAEAGIDKNLADRARKMAAVPAEQFEEMVGDWRERVAEENERVTTNLLKAGEKKLARDEKEAALAEKMRAAAASLGQGSFGVIYADPPWRFEPYSRDTGMDRAADNHYPTMDVEAIAAMDVPAADDCVLFLWATAPMLPQALDVMSAWGFAYKSQIIWAKDRIGTGYWARNKHEILLIGTRGNIPAPAPGTQPESIIQAPVGAHSAKPAIFAELIERLFPTLPKIEMFARISRPGWHGWGAEHSDEPVAATDTAGDYLREPVAVVSGQIIRERDAPRETDRSGGDASGPDTELQSDGVAIAAVKGKARLANAAGVEPPPSVSIPQPAASTAADTAGDVAPPPASPAAPRVKTIADYRPHCQRPDACGATGLKHCHSCQKIADAARTSEATQ